MADAKRPAHRQRRPALFPDPGPEPTFSRLPRDEAERARMENELHDWQMRDLIHQAVHMNDPELRNELAGRVAWYLRQGWPLSPDIRRWLSWVLERLQHNRAVPHLG